MNNNCIKKVLSLAVITAALTAATVVEAANQPNFPSDTLTTHLAGFSSAITVRYTPDNGVYISGLGTVPPTMSSFPVTILSANKFEPGYPKMDIDLSDGTDCSVQFSDAPLSLLDYKSGVPICTDVKVGLITQRGPHQYDVTLTYNK